MEGMEGKDDCPICLGDMVRPFTTACGHVFCHDCLTRSTTRSDSCPLCRSAISVPSGEQLPVLEELSNDDLYHRVLELVGTDDSRSLALRDPLVHTIREILTRTDTTVRVRLCAEHSEFSHVYQDTFVLGKPYFVRITDPYIGFSLAWLFHLYH